MKKSVFLLLSVFTIASCKSGLPKPELESGIRGQQFGIDKNINEKTIDKYLNRADTVYRDMRMLVDPASYENIDGDSYLSGFVKGFEVVPYPYIVNVSGLPEAVGSGYQGDTLYTFENNIYTANYEESDDIIEALFPKDKYIFLMCGGGGYAGMMKNFLIAQGWNKDKIYNVGGYWFYEGKNDVKVKREDTSGNVHYDFYKVAYHDIDFSALTRK